MASPQRSPSQPAHDFDVQALEKAAGFGFLDENEFLVPRPARIHPLDPSYDCGCRNLEGDSDICCSDACVNHASRTECIVGSCSKRRCRNKRFQRKEYAKVEVFEVSSCPTAALPRAP
jgi:hypothetical protein